MITATATAVMTVGEFQAVHGDRDGWRDMDPADPVALAWDLGCNRRHKEIRWHTCPDGSMSPMHQRGPSADLVVWVATRPGVLSTKELRLFAVFCCLRATYHMDARGLAAVHTADRWANQQATDSELAAAHAGAVEAVKEAQAVFDAAMERYEAGLKASYAAGASYREAHRQNPFPGKVAMIPLNAARAAEAASRPSVLTGGIAVSDAKAAVSTAAASDAAYMGHHSKGTSGEWWASAWQQAASDLANGRAKWLWDNTSPDFSRPRFDPGKQGLVSW